MINNLKELNRANIIIVIIIMATTILILIIIIIMVIAITITTTIINNIIIKIQKIHQEFKDFIQIQTLIIQIH